MTTNERELLAIPREEIERTINVLRMSAHPQPSPHADALAEYLALPPHPEPHGEKAEGVAVDDLSWRISFLREYAEIARVRGDIMPAQRLRETAALLEASAPASAVAEPVAFRFRKRGGCGLWHYVEYDTRGPDSYELRECEIENVYAAPQPPAQATPDRGTSSAVSVPPIDRDESYDRSYMPMPGGWEIQTKGRGSSFRICDTKSGDRLNIPQQPYLFELLERMGREVHAAWTALASSPAAPAPVIPESEKDR